MTKKTIILGIISLIFIITILGLSIFFTREETKCLNTSSEYAIGQVEDIIIYKGKTIKAYFRHNGKKYLASDKAYDAKDPVKIGDKFYVHYCKENPNNNSILFDRRVE